MAEYKGIFYDFDSEAQFDALVQKIRGRCTKEEGGCEIWPGGVSPLGAPVYKNSVQWYNLRRLIFQLANPEYVLPDSTFKLVCSCGNDKCLFPEHVTLELKERVLWNIGSISERLNAGCTRSAPAAGFEVGCLLWNKYINPRGYGTLGVDRTNRFVHVIAMLLHDNITTPPTAPDGAPLIVRHKCTNKHCCEVTHLEWGTHQENGGDRVRDNTNRAGEDHPLAQMTSETASAIKLSWRQRSAPDYLTQAQRAEKFGVTVHVVNNIDCGSSWAHLPGPPNKPMKVASAKDRATRDDLTEDIMATLLSRIQAKVDVTPGISKDPAITTPCHIFTGASIYGYGNLKYKNTNFRTHVLVCEHKMKKRTPDNFVVRHRCGNRLCCAADHLEFGTRTENWLDAIAHGDIECKFSVDEVRRIRTIPITDTLAIQQAAENHKVRYDYIQGIINRRIWSLIE